MSILTGPEIRKRQGLGELDIDPWVNEHVGPASVDLRLHHDLLVYKQFLPLHESMGSKRAATGAWQWWPPLDMRKGNPTEKLAIPDEGLVLYPGILYLGRTVESIWSDRFVPQVTGRSSVGRLGVQVHATAGYGDPGFEGTITLEIMVVHPICVYAEERVCQVYFTTTKGEPKLYEGRYQKQVDPTASRFHLGDGEW
jgi:dCTP deaminase